jgi:hypothetical protein
MQTLLKLGNFIPGFKIGDSELILFLAVGVYVVLCFI